MDENHADCILRACSVHLLRTNDSPSFTILDAIESSNHEYLAWRAYDNKQVHALVGLPSKKLKDACDIECKRGPQGLAQAVEPDQRKRKAPVIEAVATGPLQMEELLAIWLPRKHLELWLDTSSGLFNRVVTGT